LGTAGGLYLFRDAILKGDPKTIIVMHADVCCSFPLEDMLAMHIEKEAIGTMLGTKVYSKGILTRFPLKQHATTVVLYPIRKPMRFYITLRNHPRISPRQSIVAYTFSTPLFSLLSAKS
jgi:mannose-1-phosphate guanylyltransferase